MKQMDLDSAIDILETYESKHKGKANYLIEVISELKEVYKEMEKYNRENTKIILLPWDED